MSIKVENLGKAFEVQEVLKGVSETFAEGRISVLLGPSGCGKTTTLRCIAGLERPTRGRISLGTRVVYQDAPAVWIPTERRNLAMVFQSYAIWPHMTVSENVSLPLQAAKVDKPRIAKAVRDTLEMVGLAAYAHRSVTQLSGGQQQRVALARCIVSEAPVILMDEPLSNLDAKLRVAMRGEIRQLQRKLGRTILFVTHDQEEALSIADSLYLYREGAVVQHGNARELYEQPRTRYAAEFLGRANILADFSWSENAGVPVYRLGDAAVLPASATPPAPGSVLCIRPEKWRITSPLARDAVRGSIVEASFIGDRTEYLVETSFGRQLVVALTDETHAVGEAVGLSVGARDIRPVEA
ncbi:MAG: ABC transporter ATP-binding protein [Lautropia sp.]